MPVPSAPAANSGPDGVRHGGPAGLDAAPARTFTAEAALFLAALALRLTHLLLYRDDFWLRTPLLDDNVFCSWAGAISREGWLARSLGTFYLNPGYPYLLALLGKVMGSGPTAVFAFQHVLGSLAAVLAFRLSLVLFDRRTAWAAGGLCALYGPAFFFESRYLGELHIYLLNAAWLLCLARARVSPRPRLRWLAAGLCLGASAVFRPTALILAPLSILWGLWTLWDRKKELALSLAVFALGLWMPLLPFQLRNRIVDPASGWGLTTASAGVNLYMGNNPEADGLNKPPSFARYGPGHQYQDYKAEAQRRVGRALTAREADRYWVGRTWEWFRARPREAWRLVWRKAGYFWNHQEPPDNFFAAIFTRFSRLGPVPLAGWGMVAPLGLAGMLWGAGLLRRDWLLHAYVLAYLAVNAAFVVLSRYRFPAAAGLIPFAAFALAKLYALAASRSWLKAGALALLLAPCFWLTRLPLIGEEYPAVTHYSMAVIYANQGWKDQAAAEYRLSIEADPTFAAPYLNLGLLQAQRGQAAEAVWALERAGELEVDAERALRIRRAVAELKAAGKGPPSLEGRRIRLR